MPPVPGLAGGPGALVAPPPPPPGQPGQPPTPAYDLEALKRLAAGGVPDTKAVPKSMGFSGFTLQTSAPAQRDNDSVQKMLARLQGNVQGAKQALSASGSAPVPLPFVQQASHKLSGNSGLADADWEPLQASIKAALSRSEIEEASRDFLKKFAQLSVEQIAEILRLMETKAASYPKDFYTELGSMLGHKLKSATSPQLALTMSSFLYWSHEGRQRFIDCSRDFLAVASAEVRAAWGRVDALSLYIIFATCNQDQSIIQNDQSPPPLCHSVITDTHALTLSSARAAALKLQIGDSGYYVDI